MMYTVVYLVFTYEGFTKRTFPMMYTVVYLVLTDRGFTKHTFPMMYTVVYLVFTDGGFAKHTFPMAYTVTTLAWGMIEFRQGYVLSGEETNMLNNLRWGLDYLLKCKLSDTSVVALVGIRIVRTRFPMYRKRRGRKLKN